MARIIRAKVDPIGIRNQFNAELSEQEVIKYLPETADKILLLMTIPGYPPSVNHTYNNNTKGSYYKNSETKEWQASMACIAASKAHVNGRPYKGDVGFYMLLEVNDNRRRDVDNRFKAMQDVLKESGVIYDDSQIFDLRGIKIRGEFQRTTAILFSMRD